MAQDPARAGRLARLAWPHDAAPSQDRLRQAREDLRGSGVLAVPVSSTGARDVIERSWRRCVDEEVPARLQPLPFTDIGELQPRLRAAAAPVLDRLSDQLSGVRVGMFLCDDRGRILLRQVSEPSQRGALDDAGAAEGFDFSELSIGTNALGSVVQERTPMLVHGSEHYNEVLEPLTCAGTPIFEPFTGQLLGAFALASQFGEANPLMCAMATDVGRQIEGNLAAMLDAHERTLISSYLVATRSGREPVIVVTERSAFANTAGLSHVTPEAHALLWMHLSEAGLARGRHRTSVPLPSGWVDALVEHVDGTGPAASAYAVRLLGAPSPVPAPTPSRRRLRAAPSRPGPRLHVLPDIDAQVAGAVSMGEVLAVDGAAGTGKLHVAVAALSRTTGVTPVVVDLAHEPCPPGLGDERRPVVLRHLQDIAPRDVNRVKAAVESANGQVAVTVDLDSADPLVRGLVAQLCTTVRLPSLREMPEKIPVLVTDLLQALPEDQRSTRFSSDALQLLMRWSWPGNVGELRRTVEHVARRRPGRTVGTADLPPGMQQVSPRALGAIESAERDLIVTALQRAGGNRSQAAQALGIGRTTLYRKVRAYRIDVDRA